MMRPSTPQTLDPLGGLTARIVVAVVIVTTLLVTVHSTIVGIKEVISPAAAAVSLAAVVGALVILFRASSPFRAPFSRRSHALIVLLLATGAIFEVVASYGTNTLILDGYSYLVAALFMFPLGSFRTPISVIRTGAALGALFGVLAFVQAPFLLAPYPPVVFAIVTMTPVMATASGAAALCHHLISSLKAWRAELIASDQLSGATQIVPLPLIASEIVPLLEHVVTTGSITASDAASARQVGERLRRELVAESDAAILPSWQGLIDDPSGQLGRWTMGQRAAMLALAEKVAATEPRPRSALVLGSNPSDWLFEASWVEDTPLTRAQVAPFAAMLGVTFGGVDFTVTPMSIRVTGRQR